MKAKLHSKALALSAGLLMFATLGWVEAQPSLSPPVLSTDLITAQITLSNCTNTTLQYFLQTSTDLVNWSNVQASYAVFQDQVVTIPATNQAGFYQLVTNVAPVFQAAIMVVSNLDMHGNNMRVDSFDSSTPYYSQNGQYVSSKALANGNVYAGSVISNTVNLGNGNIWGRVATGPGTTQTNVHIGNNGSVGDVLWEASNKKGIEPGYWSGGFVPTLLDVVPPVGGVAFPAPTTNGHIVLNGGNYAATDPVAPLIITATTQVWIQGSYNGNITIATNASLVLYVGTTSGSGDSLSWSGQSTVNTPGYAANLQIYGLPSLNTIDLTGGATFIATIYAPEADMIGGGGGVNTLDSSGAFVCRSVTLDGKWNFHYDQSLTNNGPGFFPGSPPLGN